jgi:hypothetical protein
MAGNPAGPGSSPMAAPGAGAGNQAAAVAALKGAFPLFYKLLSAFPAGSEDWENINEAMKRLGKVVGKAQESLVPSAIQQMMLAAKQGGPLKNAPPVGIQAAPANSNVASPQEPEPV